MVFKLCILFTMFMVLTANVLVLLEEIPGDKAATSKYFQNIPDTNNNAADEESSEMFATKRRSYRAVNDKYASRRPAKKSTESVKSKDSGWVSNMKVAGKKPKNKSSKVKYTSERTSEETTGDVSIKSIEKETSERVTGKKPVNKSVKIKYTEERPSEKSTGDKRRKSPKKESSEKVTGNKPYKSQYTAESPADDVSNNVAEEGTPELGAAPKPVDVQIKYDTQSSVGEAAGDISDKSAGKQSSERVAAKKPTDKKFKRKYTDEGSADDVSNTDEEKDTTVKVDSKEPFNKTKIVKSENPAESPSAGDVSSKVAGQDSTGQWEAAPKETVDKTVDSKYKGESSAGVVSSKAVEEEPKVAAAVPKEEVDKTANSKYKGESYAGDVSTKAAEEDTKVGGTKKLKNTYTSADGVSSKGAGKDYADVGNRSGMEDNFSAYDAAVMDFASNHDSHDDDDDEPQVKQCRSIYRDCKRSSPLISDYLICFASFAPCISENSKICQNKCGSDLVSCMKKVKHNSWKQNSECASKYINCNRDKCN